MDSQVGLEKSNELQRFPSNLFKTLSAQYCASVMTGNLFSSRKPVESVELFEMLEILPSERVKLESFQNMYRDILTEREKITKKLRNMADQLQQTREQVLIADRVGTGVGIGAGFIILGGLLAAPFTAGGSLIAVAAGVTTSLMGGVTSAGANLADYLISKHAFEELKNELEEHNVKMDQLSMAIKESKCLKNATRFRPTMKHLANLSEHNLARLFTMAQSIILRALNNDNRVDEESRTELSSETKELLQKLIPCSFDAETNEAIVRMLDYAITQIESIYQAIKAFACLLETPELAKMVCALNSIKSASVTGVGADSDASRLKATFQGTPLGMSSAARGATAVFTAVFIAVDIIHMIRICNETGETPSVKKLRELADELENQAKIADNLMMEALPAE